MSNEFLPFCPTDTGTNLPTQADYLAATDRVDGNQPGVASSKLNNKALRQANAMVSSFGDFLAAVTGADILDNGVSAQLLSQMKASLLRQAPVATTYLTGSGTHNRSFCFFVASGSATVGATYTNNAVTFTVAATVASGTLIRMTGAGAPTVSGTLTKASGTGDATLTFYAAKSALFLRIRAVGGGGGGGGSGTTGTGNTGTAGGDTTFGGFLTAGGGASGTPYYSSQTGGVGGAASITTSSTVLKTVSVDGARGSGMGGTGLGLTGGNGANSFFGGGGMGGTSAGGLSGIANTGGGGGGAGGTSTVVAATGGGAGAYCEALYTGTTSSFSYAIGAAGTGGNAGTSGGVGGGGAVGQVIVEEYFQ